jgi:uroporphyrin-III C-methyltransferase
MRADNAPNECSICNVWIVGAGPGDPELLTLKAARLIAQADVLLVDELVDRRILEHARPGTRIVNVGKRGGCPSTPQAFIERLTVHEARAGRRVVRLKGGDPMVFGRAGEELDALRAAGLRAEVVPGISAALGAASSLQVSLTDRRASAGVVFVTGHAKPGGEEPPWEALARSGLTLVVYMGLQRAASVAGQLLAAGRHADTPAAVVLDATLTTERRHLTTLGALAQDAALIRERALAAHGAGLAGAAGRHAAGLLVIGEVLEGLAHAAARREGAATIAACQAA